MVFRMLHGDAAKIAKKLKLFLIFCYASKASFRLFFRAFTITRSLKRIA